MEKVFLEYYYTDALLSAGGAGNGNFIRLSGTPRKVYRPSCSEISLSLWYLKQRQIWLAKQTLWGMAIITLDLRGLSLMTAAKISDILNSSPLVRKFTHPPLLRLLTMSAFEGTPSPLSADVINGSPLILSLKFNQ